MSGAGRSGIVLPSTSCHGDTSISFIQGDTPFSFIRGELDSPDLWLNCYGNPIVMESKQLSRGYFSGSIADNVSLRYFLTVGMIGMWRIVFILIINFISFIYSLF